MIALRIFEPSEPFEPSEQPLRLRGYYEKYILPEIKEEQSPGSLIQDRVALNHWEALTENPTIDQINRDHVIAYRDGLIKRGLSPATINKCWRELRAMFNWAADENYIVKAPSISRRSKSKLVKQPPKIQRETLTIDEVSRLYLACRKATYPTGGEVPAPKLWRVAIVLWWFYGARTMDVIGKLTWDNIHWNDRLLVFVAQKTGKLQGLPLTDLVAAHLKSIKRKSNLVFPGFKTKGCYLKEKQLWKNGYYTTWRNEIQPDAGLTGIKIKHFREAMITRNNGIEPGLGKWIAGHYMPGVTEQFYDFPTQRIRNAITRTPVPDCFNEFD